MYAFVFFRTVFLRLASIGVLSFSLNARITGCDDPVCGNCDNINVSFYPSTFAVFLYIFVCLKLVSLQCWETYVGQEYYKLVIVDFFVIVGVTFFVEFPRR